MTLNGIGVDPELSAMSKTFAFTSLPAFFAIGLIDLTQRWLASQRVTDIPMLLMLISTAVHVPLCLALVYNLEFGVLGLSIANSIKQVFLLIFLVIYCLFSTKIRKSLTHVSRETFQDWGVYLALAVPAMIFFCSEGWAFEFYQLVGSTLGINECAIMTICITVHTSMWSVSFGV